jgi:hypothetical protein
MDDETTGQLIDLFWPWPKVRVREDDVQVPVISRALLFFVFFGLLLIDRQNKNSLLADLHLHGCSSNKSTYQPTGPSAMVSRTGI